MTGWRLANSRWTARWLTLAVAIAAFAIYHATLHPSFFPGASSQWVALFLGIERYRPGQYLLWRKVGEIVSLLPFGSLPGRMNMLSALCGALSVALTFATIRTLLLLLAVHATTVSSRRRKHAATAAGLLAALALGGATPFWLASTRCLPQTFEILLLLAMGWLLIRTAVGCRELPLALFGILLGMSALEWDTGLRMLPLMLFLAWRAMRTGQLNDARGYAALSGGLLVGGLSYLWLTWLAGQQGGVAPGSFIAPLRGAITLAKANYKLVVHAGWSYDSRPLTVICFAILPWLAACALAIWRSESTSATSSSGLLSLALTGTTLIALIGVSISPWGAYRPVSENELPCTVYLLVAFVVGYLTGHGYLLAGGRLWSEKRPRRSPRREDEEEGGVSYPDAAVGRLMVLSMLVLTSVVALINAGEVRAWREPLSSKLAVAVITRLPPRTWLVADARFNTLIRLYARVARRRVSLVGNSGERAPESVVAMHQAVVSRDAAFAGLDLAPLHGALATNSAAFLHAWMSLDPKVEDKLMVLSHPDLWETAGLQSLPDVVAFRGTRNRAAAPLDALLAEHARFWDEIEALPPADMRMPAWLKGRRAEIRLHLARVGDSLAALLAAAGRSAEADAILERMRRLRDEPRPLHRDIIQ